MLSQPITKSTSLLSNGWILLILFIALGLRIGAAVYWHGKATADQHFFRLGDSHGYWILAGHLAKGEPYQYGSPNASVFRAPMMPLLLAPFTKIADESTAILCARIMAGAVLGTLAVALVACLACRLAGQKAAVAAAGLACCYPSAIGMSVIVLSEMLFVPMMLGFLLLWNWSWNATSSKQRWSIAFLCGLVGGLAVLTRPSWLLFAPFVGLIGILIAGDRRTHVQIMLAIGLGTVFVMTPWWIRNYNITGKFVLTTLQVGPSLLDSFHEGASGGSDEGMQFMREIERQQMEADRLYLQQDATRTLEGTLEWRINQSAQREALAWASKNPLAVVQLAWAKFRRTWSPWPDGGDVGSPMIRLAVTLSCLSVLLLAFAASFQLFANHSVLLAICWSPCLYFTALHMVFVGSVRYREPAMIVLIAVAGCALARLSAQLLTSKQENARVHSTLPESTAT